MTMNRRSFLQAGAAALVAATGPRFAAAATGSADAAASIRFEPMPQAWRVFEVTTRIELLSAAGRPRVWLPLPSVHDDAWMRPMGNRWSGNADDNATRDRTPLWHADAVCRMD